MPRAPSFAFERRERQKAKAAKRAEKTKVKADKKADKPDGSDATQNAVDLAIAEDKLQN